jgi:hypothetical protein
MKSSVSSLYKKLLVKCDFRKNQHNLSHILLEDKIICTRNPHSRTALSDIRYRSPYDDGK